MAFIYADNFAIGFCRSPLLNLLFFAFPIFYVIAGGLQKWQRDFGSLCTPFHSFSLDRLSERVSNHLLSMLATFYSSLRYGQFALLFCPFPTLSFICLIPFWGLCNESNLCQSNPQFSAASRPLRGILYCSRFTELHSVSTAQHQHNLICFLTPTSCLCSHSHTGACF